MARKLRLKCSNCGHWNRVPVNKIFIEQPSSEPKVKVLIPIYESKSLNARNAENI